MPPEGSGICNDGLHRAADRGLNRSRLELIGCAHHLAQLHLVARLHLGSGYGSLVLPKGQVHFFRSGQRLREGAAAGRAGQANALETI